ncbi:MAG: sodium:glutamate symporter [Spirochaetes bacterium]|nr:MAG: sodium:glutamate symporter [Spirochaetota bacterium]
MNFSWTIFIDLGIIAGALLLATLIRAKVRFFQKYLIPNSLTAGFLILPFYNFLAPQIGLNTDGLGNLVFHLLNLSFIAMSLRKGTIKGSGKRIFGMTVTILSEYVFQGLLGLGLTFLFIATILPNLFPSIGFFIPLGFAMGPGQSYAIGKGWESFGFQGAGSIGLTFAAIGFLWACFGGVYLINLGIKRGWLEKEQVAIYKKKGIRTGVYSPETEHPVGARLTTETEAIDSMSYNVALVLVVYVLTFLLLKLLTYLLSFAGSAGHDLAVNLWGISFIFAAIIAMIVKKIMGALKITYTIDNGSMTRIAGTSVDIMVAASIGAISLVIVSKNWLPILTLGILGGIVTIFTLLWITSRIFEDHQFHRTIMLYGAMTGTLPTGLALLRVIDPEFETPVASDYMYATGLTFIFAIPFILIINFPAYGFKTGNPVYYWITLAVFIGYLIFVSISYLLLSKNRAFKKSGHIWLKAKYRDN